MLSNLGHPGGEGTPVLRQLNGLHGGAQDPDAIPSQHPSLGQLHATVERRLAPEGEQYAVWALVADHLRREKEGAAGTETSGSGDAAKHLETQRDHRMPCPHGPPQPSHTWVT